MSRIREENDVNDNLSVVDYCSKQMKQKSLSEKPLNGIAHNAHDMAGPAKQSKTKQKLSEDMNDEEKESVIQEVLDYMLGHRSPVASSSDCLFYKGVAPSKEKFSPSCSHNQPSVTDFPVYRSSPPKHLNSAHFSKRNVATNIKDKKAKKRKIIVGKQPEEQRESHIQKLLEDGFGATTALASIEATYASNILGKEHFLLSKQPEQKGVKSMTPSKRRSRYWSRKRCTQPLQSDKTDSFVMQPHQNNKSQSSKTIVQTSSNGSPYWPRVLISSHLNVLFSRINAENDNMFQNKCLHRLLFYFNKEK
ncbi:Uncharacterized protein APZ42_025459 [Daphnia magna]|uniref:Uncharacterized protein n=1 Tax=Daphnia magna TaxID=35525 RepID=A0A164T278_9CRUS|nr:Uncharacterized protein APZ42_025459 [Daphnia magna]